MATREGRGPGELTVLSIGLGLLIAFVMTAANVYLGLYAGMTVSASIPAAVLGLAAYRLLGRRDPRAVNMVQTLASSGESLAAGAIFTIPALVLVGAWQDFKFWPTTLIVVSGGLLGIAFMVPLRRLLIVESPELTYPEGVACAEVLKSGTREAATGEGRFGGGVAFLLKGFLLGAAFKLLASGFGLLSATVEWAARLGGSGKDGGRIAFFGSDLSPALLSVGYITGLGVASQVFLGGALAWIIGLPLLALPEALASAAPLEAAWGLWSQKIRYLGVGAMVVGGIGSLISIRKGMAQGVRRLLSAHRAEGAGSAASGGGEDMPGRQLLILLAAGLLLTFGVYLYLLKAPLLSLVTTVLMAVAAFLFVGVSSYIVGLVGSSNNPVSGMTISALLGTAAFFLVLGFRGDSAVLATLGVAAVVCCAACSAGDCSQDLKTGHLVGSSPRLQQYAEVIGAVFPALVIAPVLAVLHHAYTIGSGGLKAPQATLFASLTQGIFGQGVLPYGLIAAGAGLGLALLVADGRLKARGSKFRLHPMPVAVGLYLPLTLSVPIFLGGLVRHWAGRRGRVASAAGVASLGVASLGGTAVAGTAGVNPVGAAARDGRQAAKDLGAEAVTEASDRGVLVSSGLIAGESILGVGLAVLVYLGVKLQVAWHPGWLAGLSVALFLALAGYLARPAGRP